MNFHSTLDWIAAKECYIQRRCIMDSGEKSIVEYNSISIWSRKDI